MNRAALVVSLDFEMYWGVHDLHPLEDRKSNLLQVRSAVSRILELFEAYEIHATWATVGMLFCHNRQELMEAVPELQPTYAEPRFSPYPSLAEVGEDEARDPFRFGASMLRAIRQTPRQEIGTHTFSHYYALEAGQTAAQFRADLQAAFDIAAKWNIDLRSMVFPRNQVNPEYVPILREFGIESYRGSGSHWLYQARNRSSESQFRRAVRLIDAYVNLSGHHTQSFDELRQGPPFNLPSSRLMRGFMPALRMFEPLRIARMCAGIDHAAKQGEVYHLWCHPEELASNQDDNIAALRKVLGRFAWLRDHGMIESLSMGELSRRMLGLEDESHHESLDRELVNSESAW